MRFPLHSAVDLETLTFLLATALQHCLNHLPPCGGQSADFSRLIVSTVYGLVPFIASFHDLRLVLRHCGREFRLVAR